MFGTQWFYSLSEENTCNGHGLCWDNDNYDKKVFRCTGEDCMPGIPEGGLINQCTLHGTYVKKIQTVPVHSIVLENACRFIVFQRSH